MAHLRKRHSPDHRLRVRLKFQAVDQTERVIFEIPNMRAHMSAPSNRFGPYIPDAWVNQKLQMAANQIIEAGDVPNLYREQSYFVVVTTPFQIPDGPKVFVAIPLTWHEPTRKNSFVGKHTGKNLGKITTWIAFTDPIHGLRKDGLPLSYAVNPFVKRLYGDHGAQLLAYFAATQHFAERGFETIYTYQDTHYHTAVVGYDGRTAEFELEDFVGNVMFVN